MLGPETALTAPNDDQLMWLAAILAEEYRQRIALPAWIITKARMEQEGVHVMNPHTGQTSPIMQCAWDVLPSNTKRQYADDVCVELVARN